MKAIIIGTPGKGKTTLCKMIKQNYPDVAIISLGGLRSPLGIHKPHLGYETEIAPEYTDFFTNVVDGAMSIHKNFVVEGYGLNPEDALYLANKHSCPCVLLCHKNTTSQEDFELVRKYDDKDKWTSRRDDEYLKNLYSFYKEVEKSWIVKMPSDLIFSTDINFASSIKNAYDYIIDHQLIISL